MKITMNTQDHLVADDRPWLAGLIFGGLAAIFSGIGLIMLIDLEISGLVMLAIGGLIFLAFYFLVERAQLVFNRPEGWAELRRKSMHRQSSTRYSLDEVDEALVQSEISRSSSGARKSVHRITLYGSGAFTEGIPLTAAYTSGTAADEIAPVINDWLRAG